MDHQTYAICFIHIHLKHPSPHIYLFSSQIYDYYGVVLDIRVHMAIIFVPILLPTLIRNLKYLAWCMTLANICMMLGICITASYAVRDLPSLSEREYFSSWRQLPLYFGTAIFAFEGIALVLPLHNAMRKPSDFGRPLGVLNVGMAIVTVIFTVLGFLGYLKWGDNVKSSLTLNLPPGDILAQSVKVMVSLGILLGYALQFFVAIQIMLPSVHAKIGYSKTHPVRVELVFRLVMVLVTCKSCLIPFFATLILIHHLYSHSYRGRKHSQRGRAYLLNRCSLFDSSGVGLPPRAGDYPGFGSGRKNMLDGVAQKQSHSCPGHLYLSHRDFRKSQGAVTLF